MREGTTLNRDDRDDKYNKDDWNLRTIKMVADKFPNGLIGPIGPIVPRIPPRLAR